VVGGTDHRLLAFGYFIPTMIRLMSPPDSAQSAARAAQWNTLNYGRHLLVLIAWIAAMRALILVAQPDGVNHEGRDRR
jgi:hypothetical protein